MPTFQDELLAKQKKMMDRVEYRSGVDRYGPGHKTIQEELVEEVKKIAAQIPNAKVIQPPDVKSFERADKKVQGQYAGEWKKIGDLNRCTLVVPAASKLGEAFRRTRDHFMVTRHGSRLQFLRGKEHQINDPLNPCGYSGSTVFIRTAGSHEMKGEIQINYPPMMFAKQTKEFVDTFGQGEAGKMRMRYAPVPGGLGHQMYEEWQKQETTPTGLAHAAASMKYYDYFRSETRNAIQAEQVLEALRKLNLAGVLIPPSRPVRI
jgi:nicotinamidase-related amidase